MRRGAKLTGLALVGAVAFVACERPPATPSPTPTPTPAGRWVSGDVHLHAERIDGLSIQPERFQRHLEEEGLDVGVVLIWGVRPFDTALKFKGTEDAGPSPRLLHYDLEVSSFRGLGTGHETIGGYPDHVIGLRLADWKFPRRFFAKPIVDWVHAQGAVAGIAHAGLWAEGEGAPGIESHAPIELPACLALGQELFLSTESVSDAGFLRLYYGLLNCGFRVPLTAGSDYPIIAGRPGSPRTWVLLPDGKLTYATWVEGIRAGRTSIAANRHDRLAIRAGSRPAGEVLELVSAGEQAFAIDFQLQAKTTLELVHDGEVVATHAAEGSGTWAPVVSFVDSSWVAARCASAHTGALYVTVAGRPIRASVASARAFVAHLDRLLKEIEGQGFSFGNPTPEEVELIAAERKEAKETYERAREAWVTIEEECRAREKTRNLGK